MSGKRHPWGCTCRTHVNRPWNRPEHWTAADVDFLDKNFGWWSDAKLSRRLGRSVVALRLKAKRLGLHKRSVGFTARAVAEIFGTDGSTVAKIWIRRGLLYARSGGIREYDGRVVFWITDGRNVERFIREHPEWVDVDKMPDSPYRDLAAADPWIALPEVRRLTGRGSHYIVRDYIKPGLIRAAQRGSHWHVPLSEIDVIRPVRGGPDAIADSVFRRESTLAVRRNRRKGVGIAA